MSCKLNIHIQKWIDIVENETYRTCEDQKLLVKHVKKCFEEEDIYTDDEQLEKYLGLAKYFPYDRIFEWQEFVIALHDCTYWRESGLPRWPDLFCMIGRGAGKDGTIALESVALMSPYNGIRGYDVDICANNEDQATRPVKDAAFLLDKRRCNRSKNKFHTEGKNEFPKRKGWFTLRNRYIQ